MLYLPVHGKVAVYPPCHFLLALRAPRHAIPVPPASVHLLPDLAARAIPAKRMVQAADSEALPRSVGNPLGPPRGHSAVARQHPQTHPSPALMPLLPRRKAQGASAVLSRR